MGALLTGYLKQSVVLLEDPAIVLSCLKEPIPRPVLDAVIRYSDVNGFLALLGENLLYRECLTKTKAYLAIHCLKDNDLSIGRLL